MKTLQTMSVYKQIFIFAVSSCSLILVYFIFFGTEEDGSLSNIVASSRYLVNSVKCNIIDFDPFDRQVENFFQTEKYLPCRKLELLTYVRKTRNKAFLHVNTEILPSYTENGVSCCYSNITRRENMLDPDKTIKISECIYFKNNVRLFESFIMVVCEDLKTNKTIYRNTHAVITAKMDVKRNLNISTDNINPFSILLVGIDSISRLNFIRTLPTAHKFMVDNDWISLKGYNKIADNTYPNIMAILCGYSKSESERICEPETVGMLDRCPFLWYDFKSFGYVTGYAEDESWLSTFNLNKAGFAEPPTDYYFRPYMLGAEKLHIVKKDEMIYCTGPETSGERILNLAKDFAITFKDNPNFGLFWMNSFSHNNLNAPTGMDKKITKFLKDITKKGVLENSIIIFFSDHGFRFGKFRDTTMGWLEERLPFIYISIPKRFQLKFPTEYTNLKNNVNKLTNPYDLYMTLQHSLVLSGLNYTVTSSSACPSCKSLFNEIEFERSCDDAAISPHWCTCIRYYSIDKDSKIAKNASKYLIEQIHKIIHAKSGEATCARYSLRDIVSVHESESFKFTEEKMLLLVIETKPNAVFETTLLYKGSGDKRTFKIGGGISRIDKYELHSRCTNDAQLKIFCYCNL